MIWQFILDLLNIATEVWLGYWIFDVPSCRRFHSRQARILEYVMFLGLPGGFGLANRLTGIRFSLSTGVILGTLFFIVAVSFRGLSLTAGSGRSRILKVYSAIMFTAIFILQF